MKNITAIVCVHNTKKLLKKAIDSLRLHYPSIHIVIVNNNSTDVLDYTGMWPNTTVYNLKENIGHGPAIHFAMQRIDTKYALIMDSDIEVVSGGVIEEMLSMVSTEIFYGIGSIVKVNDNGINVGKDNSINYLHPYFCLIDKSMYFSFHKAINHGAPFIAAMTDIKKAEMSEEVLISFPVGDYVNHRWRGTRDLNGGNGPKGWTKNWDRIK